MNDAILKKFGRYFLLDRIGEGGMADIFRARLAAPGASGRFLVIKRIQSAFGNKPDFVSMFRSEVQMTMRFTHPNIVQLYESGEENGQQFIAMELVEGRNLRQILSKVSQRQLKVPVPVACEIIEQAAVGLHYAHSFKDRITGEALNLVHRDVSPQNILVSYDGNIKVIDFGIAKAANSGDMTRSGVIKGKLSYLSPEQVMGDTIDGRSDLFSLGIVMWELLTAKRLFVSEGENDFAVLKMIDACGTHVKPPSSVNPDIPPEVDAIVMRALSRDRRNRFQNCEEMARAIRKVLNSQYPDFSTADLSVFTKKLFHEWIVEDRKQLQTLNTRAEELISLGFQNAERESVSPSTRESGLDSTRVGSIGDKFEKQQIKEAEKIELTIDPGKQMKVPSRSAPAVPGATRAPPVSLPDARSRNEGAPAGIPVPAPVRDSGRFFHLVIRAMVVAGMIAASAWYLNSESSRKKAEESARARATGGSTAETSLAIGAGVKPGTAVQLRLRLIPDGDLSSVRATLNGTAIDLYRGMIDVIAEEPLELVVERPGFVTYRKQFSIKTSEIDSSGEHLLEVRLDPMEYGTFSLSTVPAIADVTITSLDPSAGGDSGKIELKAPVESQKLTAGRYRVMIRNDILGVEKSFLLEIRKGDHVIKNGEVLEKAGTKP